MKKMIRQTVLAMMMLMTMTAYAKTQDVGGKGALQDKLKPKQKLVVQVVKEPVGHKGPRVTTEI